MNPLEKPWTFYLNFMGHFWVTFLVSLLQAAAPSNWIMILGFFVLFNHSTYNGMDLNNTNAFVSMFKGLTGGEGSDPLTYLITTGIQFGGAFVGALVFILIAGAPSGPSNTALTDIRLIFFFLFANMAQAGCLSNFNMKCTQLQTCFNVAVTYMTSIALCQFTFPGSIGGFTVDFARMLASKIFEGDAYGASFDKFWILLIGSFGGILLGAATVMVEGKLKAKEGGDAAAEPEAAQPEA